MIFLKLKLEQTTT